MPDYPLRDQAAIVGVGATPYSKNSGVSTLTMALRAISAAVEDAGLTLDDIDGVACHRVNDSAPASIVAESIGNRTCTSSSTSSVGAAPPAPMVRCCCDGRGRRSEPSAWSAGGR